MSKLNGFRMNSCETELGKFLRSHRLRLGISQQNIADAIGVNQVTYSSLERGVTKFLNPKYIEVISSVFKCDKNIFMKFVRCSPKPKTSVSRLIRARREELGLSRESLAVMVKSTISQIGYWENNVSSISYKTAERFSRALKLDIAVMSAYITKVKRRKNKDSNSLGNFIRNRRVEMGISSQELANRLKVCRNYVSLIELGKTPLRRNNDLLMRIAEILAVNIKVLMKLKSKRKLILVKSRTEIGKFIISRCRELNLSHSDLAKLCRMEPSHMSMIVKGRIKNPGIETMSKIYSALHVLAVFT